MTANSWFGSEFIAALVGALVAGGISGGLQWQSFALQRKIRLADQKRVTIAAAQAELGRETILAFSIGLKLNRSLTAIQQVKEHLDESFLEALRDRMDLASAIRPFSSDFARVSFTLDELNFVRSLKKAHLVNHIIDVPGILDLYIDNMAMFRTMKLAITDLASTIELSPSGRASSVYKDRNAYIAKLRLAEANVLVGHLLGRAVADYPMVHCLFRDFQNAAINRLGRQQLQFIWDISEKPIFKRRKA